MQCKLYNLNTISQNFASNTWELSSNIQCLFYVQCNNKISLYRIWLGITWKIAKSSILGRSLQQILKKKVPTQNDLPAFKHTLFKWIYYLLQWCVITVKFALTTKFIFYKFYPVKYTPIRHSRQCRQVLAYANPRYTTTLWDLFTILKKCLRKIQEIWECTFIAVKISPKCMLDIAVIIFTSVYASRLFQYARDGKHLVQC